MASSSSTSGSFFAYPTPGDIIAVASILPIICIVAVILRFRARRIHKARIGIDDWLMLAALILLIGMGVDLIIGVKMKALGYPTPVPVSPTPEAIMAAKLPQITITMKTQYTFQLLMIAALGRIKLGVLFFYRRVFVIKQTAVFSIITISSIIIIILWTLGFLLAFAFNCRLNFWAFWGSEYDLMKNCDHGFGGEQAIVITDFITDVIVLLLPLPILFRLHLPTLRKFGLIGVFLLGGVALAASLVKLIIFMVITTRGYDYTEDEDLTVSTSLYWSMTEAGLALTAACLPIVRAFFQKSAFDRLLVSAKSLFPSHSSQRLQSDTTGSIEQREFSSSERDTEKSTHPEQEV